MAAVVRAQFSASKASAGGRAGALALAENEHIFQSLCCEGEHFVVHRDARCAFPLMLPNITSWVEHNSSDETHYIFPPCHMACILSVHRIQRRLDHCRCGPTSTREEQRV